jgi:hypothetical protein
MAQPAAAQSSTTADAAIVVLGREGPAPSVRARCVSLARQVQAEHQAFTDAYPYGFPNDDDPDRDGGDYDEADADMQAAVLVLALDLARLVHDLPDCPNQPIAPATEPFWSAVAELDKARRRIRAAAACLPPLSADPDGETVGNPDWSPCCEVGELRVVTIGLASPKRARHADNN